MQTDFIIHCIPPRATGQSTTRVGRSQSGRSFVYKDKRGQKLRDELLILLMEHSPPEPFDGALAVRVKFVYPWRKSEPKYRRELGEVPMTSRPDLDNLLKVFLDQMQTARFFLRGDSQLAEITASKSWGDLPRIEVGLMTI